MISPILPFKIYNAPKINFCGNKSIKNDTFERERNIQNFEFKIYSPFSMKKCSQNIVLDLNRPKKINLDKCNLILDYDPKRVDYLWDKVENKPIKVNILESSKGNERVFTFMSPDLKKEYGYTHIGVYANKYDFGGLAFLYEEIAQDYPELDIEGHRIVCLYTENWDDTKVGGVGKLADKLTVKYTLDNDIEPNIVSLADKGSHIANYKRGKRFFPISSDSMCYDFFKHRYNSLDVNKIVNNLIKKADKGEHIDISDWVLTPMYMPKDVVDKYINELVKEGYCFNY